MNVEELKKVIKMCENDDTLNENQKNTRIIILTMFIDNKMFCQSYSNQIYLCLQSCGELVELLDGLYQVEATLELNRISLKGLILESSLCKMLDNNKIEYTLLDLKKCLYQFMDNENIDFEVIEKEILLYETIDNLILVEKMQMDEIVYKINDILKLDLSFENTIDSSLLLQSKNKIMIEVRKLLELNVLDQETYIMFDNLVNQVLNFYLNENTLSEKIISDIYYREC